MRLKTLGSTPVKDRIEDTQTGNRILLRDIGNRYAFCLNYFCPTLKTRLGPSVMNIPLAAVGQGLGAGWELEQSLYRWLKEMS